MESQERIVVTGMSLITPLGDRVKSQVHDMYRGKSAIGYWDQFANTGILARVGGNIGSRRAIDGIVKLEADLPKHIFDKAKWLTNRVSWSAAHSIELALRAGVDAALDFSDQRIWHDMAVIVGGTNISNFYNYSQIQSFQSDIDDIDPFTALHGLDTDHAGCVSEVLQAKAGAYVIGGACASATFALRSAIDEIKLHKTKSCLVVGAIYEPSPVDLQSLATMGAISIESFNQTPARASRPFDVAREGFVPSHGGAALYIETLTSARARGAKIYGEILAVEMSSDGNHLPQPSRDGQVRAIKRAMLAAQVGIEDINYVNMHATSTPFGDLSEAEALKEVFGARMDKILCNAPKSMLGHTCWSSGLVELVTVLQQFQDQMLYPSINIEQLDPKMPFAPLVEATKFKPSIALKNSFGFGGLNGVIVLKSSSEI